eukprot:1699988-Prymnesium_polylepis.1
MEAGRGGSCLQAQLAVVQHHVHHRRGDFVLQVAQPRLELLAQALAQLLGVLVLQLARDEAQRLALPHRLVYLEEHVQDVLHQRQRRAVRRHALVRRHVHEPLHVVHKLNPDRRLRRVVCERLEHPHGRAREADERLRDADAT